MKRSGSRGQPKSGQTLEQSGSMGVGADRELEMMEEALMDVTADELREFLEADVMDVRADPVFKEALRRRLWEFVLNRTKGETPPDDDA